MCVDVWKVKYLCSGHGRPFHKLRKPNMVHTPIYLFILKSLPKMQVTKFRCVYYICKASMWLGLGNNTYKCFNVDGTLKFELVTKGTGGRGIKAHVLLHLPCMLFSWASFLNLKDWVGSCLHLESMLTSTSQCLNLKDTWTRVAFIARLIDPNKHFKSNYDWSWVGKHPYP